MKIWRSHWGALAGGLLVVAGGAAQAASSDGRLAVGLSKSLAVEESRSGAASPHLLPLLNRLAGVQAGAGALGEAAASRRRALHIALRAYGGQSINAANAMVALADAELLRRRYTEAEPLLTAALLVLESHPRVRETALAMPLAALARIALARGDVAAAERFADRAGVIAARHALPSSEPQRVLGAVYSQQERFDDGERILRAALAQDRRRRGAGSTETARSLAQLANLMLRARRYDEALPLIEQAIAIDQERLGPAHPLISDDFADLGLIYAGLGRDDDASTALYFALDVLDRGDAGETPRAAYVELQLAPVLRRLGQADEAQRAFEDAKHILDDAADDERERERQT